MGKYEDRLRTLLASAQTIRSSLNETADATLVDTKALLSDYEATFSSVAQNTGMDGSTGDAAVALIKPHGPITKTNAEAVEDARWPLSNAAKAFLDAADDLDALPGTKISSSVRALVIGGGTAILPGFGTIVGESVLGWAQSWLNDKREDEAKAALDSLRSKLANAASEVRAAEAKIVIVDWSRDDAPTGPSDPKIKIPPTGGVNPPDVGGNTGSNTNSDSLAQLRAEQERAEAERQQRQQQDAADRAAREEQRRREEEEYEKKREQDRIAREKALEEERRKAEEERKRRDEENERQRKQDEELRKRNQEEYDRQQAERKRQQELADEQERERRRQRQAEEDRERQRLLDLQNGSDPYSPSTRIPNYTGTSVDGGSYGSTTTSWGTGGTGSYGSGSGLGSSGAYGGGGFGGAASGAGGLGSSLSGGAGGVGGISGSGGGSTGLSGVAGTAGAAGSGAAGAGTGRAGGGMGMMGGGGGGGGGASGNKAKQRLGLRAPKIEAATERVRRPNRGGAGSRADFPEPPES